MAVKTTKIPDSEVTKTDKSTDKPNFDESSAENKPDGVFFGDKPEKETASGQDVSKKNSETSTGEEEDDTNSKKTETQEEEHERQTREAITGDKDEPGEPAPDPSEPKEEEGPEDPRDARIARLERIIEDMSQSVDTDIRHKEPTKEQAEEAQAANTLLGDISDDDFDKITTSKEAFTNFLANFGDKLIAKSSETTLRTVPDVINKSIQRQSKLNNAITDFYNKNSDLKPHAKYVGYMFTQKQSESPEKDLDTLFKETEQEVRKNLQLNRTAVERENQRLKNKQEQSNSRPAKPGSGRGASRTAPADTRTDEQKQIDDILI